MKLFRDIVFRRRKTLHRLSGYAAPNRGFTLVETAFAIAILGIALFSSFFLLVHSYAIMRRTDEVLYVNRLMESALEVTRNLSYDELTSQSWPVTFSTDFPVFAIYGKAVNPAATDDPEYGMMLENPTGTPRNQMGMITAQTIAPAGATLANSDIVQITVTITWQPYRLPPASRTVATYISRNGINKR